MILLLGSVNALRQPTVHIQVVRAHGARTSVEAILDSGFNGTLAMPPPLVELLELPFWFTRKVILADGSAKSVDNFRGRILWEGIERPTRIVASGDQPLIGMGLLNGYRIIIHAVDGGAVRVESLSE